MNKEIGTKNNKIYVFNDNGQLSKKRCGHCRVFKPIPAFQKSKERKFGIHCYCKSCRSELENPQRVTRQKIYIRELRLRAYQIVSGKRNPICVMSKIWKCCNDLKNGLWLSLDHIAGDGASHKRKIKARGSPSLYRWVINHPQEAEKRLQILCMNAQVMKKRINKEFGIREEKGDDRKTK